ncbi:sensor histidine kinase KdpD [Collinsella sp. An307]|uniref:sensor histidine kinase n=1 Tax=Collinsella sp. An307 TaxID=1965630 RepID=UPI000B3777C3|nr:sensor histidine kinase KdpD [Collinsella sp. An307]OUO21709.1 histidine kinase [Collinsella sp. An307]
MRGEGDGRTDPDRLLQAIGMGEGEASASRRGQLKIFFGYAAGVGKTYAMLSAAQAARRRGVDVVAGYVEPHDRPETRALLSGLEVVEPRLVRHGAMELAEFDLDATLARAPRLALVDELAHTNAPGSRHAKRYQDVEELLRAGIDVYTTVNVQHIESLNDMVASITGVVVRERIPDRVFDDADHVELVDIEPEDLLERLREGRVYHADQARRAQENFFTVENLTALREIALRRCADRTGRLAAAARVLNNRDYHTSEHILVCVSPSPANPRIVRTAARMARALSAQLTALFVETPLTQGMPDADRDRLRENMALAEQLGAAVETVYGDDVAFQIAEFARLSGVSEIVMGRSGDRRGLISVVLGRPSLTDRLIALAPNLDIHIIPDRELAVGSGHPAATRGRAPERDRNVLRHVLVTCALIASSTGIGIIFHRLGFADSSIISLYILVTLLTAITTTGRICTLLSSVLSVMLYNYCFVAPLYSLQSFDKSYLVTFAIMFVTAFIASELTGRIAQNARQAAQTAYRTRVLLETNQLLQQKSGFADIAQVAMNQLTKLLSRDIVFYPVCGATLGEPLYAEVGGAHPHGQIVNENERAVAVWTLTNNKRAGATTATLADARCLYLAVRTGEQVFGVVGIVMGPRGLDAFENSIMLSIIGECALALAREKEARERQEAAIVARNEQLRANLLRSIGHDLRTPLTAISGSAAILRDAGGRLAPEKRAELAGNIHRDALWLIDMMENLLTVTRFEDGSISLNLTSELVDDVLAEAAAHLARQAAGHRIVIEPTDGLLFARMDAGLVMQLLVNLIGNAVKYTPEGSTVTVSARRVGDMVRISVADDGPGVPDADKERIFDRFRTGAAARRPADATRSFGLGLALCRSIAEAHGGTIEVRDNVPHGAVFTFTLPAEEVSVHA